MHNWLFSHLLELLQKTEGNGDPSVLAITGSMPSTPGPGRDWLDGHRICPRVHSSTRTMLEQSTIQVQTKLSHCLTSVIVRKLIFPHWSAAVPWSFFKRTVFPPSTRNEAQGGKNRIVSNQLYFSSPKLLTSWLGCTFSFRAHLVLTYYNGDCIILKFRHSWMQALLNMGNTLNNWHCLLSQPSP